MNDGIQPGAWWPPPMARPDPIPGLGARFRFCLKVVSSIFGLLLSVGTAGAGVRLEVEMVDQRHGGQATFVGEILIVGERIRIQNTSGAPGPARNTLIYRGDRDVFWSLDPADQRYVEIDRPLITRMDERIEAAQRELEARLALLPTDQRAMARRLIGARVSASRKPLEPLRFKSTGNRRKVAGRSGRELSIHRGRKRIGDACVVGWKQVAVNRQDLAVFRKLANFLRDLMGAMGPTPLEIVPNQSFEVLAQLGGFPLRIRWFEGDEVISETRFLEMERLSLSAELFELPANYVRRGPRESLGRLLGEAPAAPDLPARPSQEASPSASNGPG